MSSDHKVVRLVPLRDQSAEWLSAKLEELSLDLAVESDQCVILILPRQNEVLACGVKSDFELLGYLQHTANRISLNIDDNDDD